MKKKRIIPFVPSKDRSKLNEGVDNNKWNWESFWVGFCVTSLFWAILKTIF